MAAKLKYQHHETIIKDGFVLEFDYNYPLWIPIRWIWGWKRGVVTINGKQYTCHGLRDFDDSDPLVWFYDYFFTVKNYDLGNGITFSGRLERLTVVTGEGTLRDSEGNYINGIFKGNRIRKIFSFQLGDIK